MSESAVRERLTADRLVLFLHELEQDHERAPKLRFGGDLHTEAASQGLSKWGAGYALTRLFGELYRDGLVEYEPPNMFGGPKLDPANLSENDLFNSRDFRLTAEGRKHARELRGAQPQTVMGTGDLDAARTGIAALDVAVQVAGAAVGCHG